MPQQIYGLHFFAFVCVFLRPPLGIVADNPCTLFANHGLPFTLARSRFERLAARVELENQIDCLHDRGR
ncbi:MAG: hypothetical protein WCF64_09510 [Methylocella sp.]